MPTCIPQIAKINQFRGSVPIPCIDQGEIWSALPSNFTLIGPYHFWTSNNFFMVALWNRETIYIFILFLSSSSSFFFFSLPNLSGRKLDVYHTLAHGVALARI